MTAVCCVAAKSTASSVVVFVAGIMAYTTAGSTAKATAGSIVVSVTSGTAYTRITSSATAEPAVCIAADACTSSVVVPVTGGVAYTAAGSVAKTTLRGAVISIASSTAESTMRIAADASTADIAASDITLVMLMLMVVRSREHFLNAGGELLIVRSWTAIVFLMGVALAARESSASSFEFLQRLRWERRHVMMLCCGSMVFMDGHGGVHDFWLDGFLVDDGLDSLVNVMMHVFAGH